MTKKPDPKQEALAAIADLEFSDCIAFFDAKATARDKQIAELVGTDDELECDNAITSEGDENGSWVLTWSWVSFTGTPLTKICECCDNFADDLKPIQLGVAGTQLCCAECREDEDAETAA